MLRRSTWQILQGASVVESRRRGEVVEMRSGEDLRSQWEAVVSVDPGKVHGSGYDAVNCGDLNRTDEEMIKSLNEWPPELELQE